jgi:dipeptidyl aminopeptidase/acylaminoacyl peptidase
MPAGTERSAETELPAVPYGAWPSPVEAQDLVTGSSQPIDVFAEAGVTWWSQTRPDQGGRQQIVRREANGTVAEVLPESWNARTRVHEYGGAAWWVHGGVIFTVEWKDQRLYRAEPGKEPVPITPVAPTAPSGPTAPSARYADGRVTPDGSAVVCVRESHEDGEVRNEIVAIEAFPPASGEPREPIVLVTGPDFVAAPRISPDGTRLAWIEWQHPNMPWDTTRLWTGDLVRDDDGLRLRQARKVAGDPDESLLQPEWGPDGALYVVSDRSDWWNVYRVKVAGPDATGVLVPVYPVAAEVGQPAWVFGQSRYLVDGGGVWLTYSDGDGAHLVRVACDGSARDDVLPLVSLESLCLDDGEDGGRIVAIGTRAAAEPAVLAIRRSSEPPRFTVLHESPESGLAPAAISLPRRISFPSSNGRTAHGLLFMPASAQVRGPAEEKPPLIVTIHGGPTAGASPAFRLSTQYWTTRGFAVVAVDYGGSTGYGRPYRRLLDDAWGIVDVEDACAAATWLAEQGLVDPGRLAIRGGSAGGFTTLAALATRDVFAAGASLFGVADLGALARDTHKFESRYLDGLVGPWPEAEAVYLERSPLSHIDGFDRPLIVLQGDEDAVVPPAQAEMIVEALAAKQVPHAYLLFAGEQHGFRKAENIIRSLEAELSFYAQAFGFEPAGSIEPVPISFADRLQVNSIR